MPTAGTLPPSLIFAPMDRVSLWVRVHFGPVAASRRRVFTPSVGSDSVQIIQPSLSSSAGHYRRRSTLSVGSDSSSSLPSLGEVIRRSRGTSNEVFTSLEGELRRGLQSLERSVSLGGLQCQERSVSRSATSFVDRYSPASTEYAPAPGSSGYTSAPGSPGYNPAFHGYSPATPGYTPAPGYNPASPGSMPPSLEEIIRDASSSSESSICHRSRSTLSTDSVTNNMFRRHTELSQIEN